jgi:RNA polymerase sigma-70 factor (ECF subfamily)
MPALAVLLRHNRLKIERICRRLCRNDESYEDVLQETYLGIVRDIGAFRGDAAFSTWVYTVARTYRGRYVRKSSRLQDRREALERCTDTTAFDDPEGLVADLELGASIEQALVDLSELDRRILVLRDVEERSAAEVSTLVGLSVPAIKTRLHRARVAARRRLRSIAQTWRCAARESVKCHCPDATTLARSVPATRACSASSGIGGA